MTPWAVAIATGSGLLVAYTFIGYPALLHLLAALRGAGAEVEQPSPPVPPGETWPLVSVAVPAYNEEAQIGRTIESLLALDYPAERLQIVIVSDGSTDRTNDIVRGYASRGVDLVALPRRVGKTSAEAAAADRLRGSIVLNTDATIRIDPGGLRELVAVFADPSIGVASGRDVSYNPGQRDPNVGERRYVGYEMWVRRLESRAGGIVGASGCCYAIRADLHGVQLPGELSRDFAAALHAYESGYRSVSVDRATCLVPRAPSLAREYRRKVRTVTRGMQTLLFKRRLLNPLRAGAFAWRLWSHKVCRWLIPWAALAGFLAVASAATTQRWAGLLAGAGLLVVLLGAVGWVLGGRAGRTLPVVLTLPAYALIGNVAVMHAAVRAVLGAGRADSLWEPTRREVG